MALASFIENLRSDDIPDNVLTAARYCVLDSIGSALGGWYSEEIPDILKELSLWTGVSNRNAAVWGHRKRMDVFPALMLNGLMSHVLELDDVHAKSKSHIGAVVVTSAWTLADCLGATGRAFLKAVIIGYEVMARVGMGLDIADNRRRGWHTTGVIGTFGAAAVASSLLQLSNKQIVSALGMAGTQSSGLWAFLAEGATCKKLHIARAAINGLTSAIMARAGMTGPSRILDAEDGGLYRAVSTTFDISALTRNLGTDYEVTKIDKKPYPCCRTTHHVIDAALSLRKSYNLESSEIIETVVETYDVGVLQCGSPVYPRMPVEAKFSIPYTLAAALVFGKVTLDEFSKNTICNSEVKRIALKTSVRADALFSERYPKRWGCRLTLALANGTRLSKQIDDMSGSVTVPLTSEQEKAKFLSLASVAFDANRTECLMQDILKIELLEQLPDMV